MSTPAECRTISVSIQRAPGEVYDFIAEPAHLPKWSFFITGMEQEGDEWVAGTSEGRVRMRFVPRNAFGVLDHWVTVNPELEVYVPMRVVANGSAGSEVFFSIFRLPGMSDAQYDEDVGMVRSDLENLKRVMEEGKAG